MVDAKPKRRRGRPRIDDESKRGQRVTINMRLNLKEAMEAAAAESGRSLSNEVQVRLEESLFDSLGENPKITKQMHWMAKMLWIFRELAGHDWRTNPDTWDRMANYVMAYLRRLGPDGVRHAAVLDRDGNVIKSIDRIEHYDREVDQLIEKMANRMPSIVKGRKRK